MGNILQFPKRNKGRVRRSTGHLAWGGYTLLQHDCDRTNLVRFNRREVDEVSNGQIALFLATAMFIHAPRETRDAIRRTVQIRATVEGRIEAQALLRIIGDA
jgi:hypothetical protein